MWKGCNKWSHGQKPRYAAFAVTSHGQLTSSGSEAEVSAH
jgi:hypothetical protein